MCLWPCCHVTTRVYSTLGEQQWTADHTVAVNAVAINSSGYVVTGGDRTADNLTTRLYDPTGALLWSKDHGAAVNAVAIDATGNVYSAGNFSGGKTVRKYDPDGNLLWSALPSSSSTAPTSIAVDTTGNVYLGDFYLTKFDSSGTELWTLAYGASESIKAIALDAAGTPHAVGGTISGLFGVSSGLGGKNTAKVSTAGVRVWVYRAINPGAPITELARGVAVDASGYVYVCGTTSVGVEKVSSTPAHDSYFTAYAASSNGIDVDPNGLIYTVDVGGFVHAYDAAKVLQWEVDHGPALNAVACNDSLAVVGGVRV